MRDVRTTDIAARVAAGHAKWHPELILVDDTGRWGHDVIDNLIAAGIPAMGIVVSEPPLPPRGDSQAVLNESWYSPSGPPHTIALGPSFFRRLRIGARVPCGLRRLRVGFRTSRRGNWERHCPR